MRLFVAVFPPEAVRQAAWDALASLRAGGAPVSWTHPRNLHYTLRFLGELGEDGARRAGECAIAAAGAHAPFAVALGGLGAFPDPRRARVLWLGATEGGEPLKALARSLEHGLRAAGFGRADRAFVPHLTIGRPRRFDQDWTPLLAAPTGEIGRFQVSELLLVQSQLSPAGSIYTPLVRAVLPGAQSPS
jgi:RNA 2',3'-cyclic 3'-phosphodiesterase